MIGRRVYPDKDGVLPPFENGDYGKDKNGRWFALPPGIDGCGGWGVFLNQPQHAWQIEEHADGTITVSPSIFINPPSEHHNPASGTYHGHLKAGVWVGC